MAPARKAAGEGIGVDANESTGTFFEPTIAHDPQRGRHVGRVTLRVRYAESDRMGIVYNAHYLTWFEIGRTELMRSAKTPYRSVEEAGLQLPLVEAALRLRSPVRYDDVIEIETWVEELRSRLITFRYRILHQSALIAEGNTIHACVRARDGRAVAFPEWLREAIGRLID
jgi:acyl-CoA thioester hydrolase